ncbi:hypothetical protein QL285_018994 [Trifolium repens]|nr:hypothetical protein QL285_018994 [Trifolium repens]
MEVTPNHSQTETNYRRQTETAGGNKPLTQTPAEFRQRSQPIMKHNTKQKTTSISEYRNKTSLRERPRNGRTRNPQNFITDLDYDGKNQIRNPQPEPSSTVQKQ